MSEAKEVMVSKELQQALITATESNNPSAIRTAIDKIAEATQGAKCEISAKISRTCDAIRHQIRYAQAKGINLNFTLVSPA